jgi:YVTN family beta-propeller protein
LFWFCPLLLFKKHIFMKQKTFSFAALLMGLFSGYVSLAQSTSGFQVVKTFHIVSSGGWDYLAVSPVADLLYVSHGTQVNILNKNTGDSVGVIPNTIGVHGIAFAPEFGKGFTSNGRLNSVTVFDIKTNKVLDSIKTGENPDAIMFDPFAKRIITCNGRSKNLTVIDPSNNTVVATIPLDGKPETTVSDAQGKVYVNIEDKSEISKVDVKANKVDTTWSIAPGESPSGLAIDRKTHRLFAGCDNKLLVVVNADDGKIVAQLPIGDGCDGTGFDDGLQYVYASCGEGVLTIIKEASADQYSVVDNVQTKKSARTCAVDEHNHQVFLSAAELEPNPPAGTRPKMLPGTFQVLVVGKK